MAETVGQHAVAAFTSPVNGTTPIDANTVRGNDNTIRVAYVDHDADPGIHVQSSALASRPVAGVVGRKWMTVDGTVMRFWYDTGSTWLESQTSALSTARTLWGQSFDGTANVSGNLSSVGNIAMTGALSGATSVSATTLAGTLSTAAQPNVTSLGTLSALTVSGNVAVNTNTLFVDAANNRVGVGTASPASALEVNGNTRLSNGTGFTTANSLVRRIDAVAGSANQFQIASVDFLTGAFSDQGQIVLSTANSSGIVERVRVDNDGNLGLGVTPSAWTSAVRFMDIGSGGSAAFGTFGGTADVALNGFFDGAWKYKATGFASLYRQQSSVHSWFTAPSGTAGNAISFTQAMTLDANGNLGVGTASPLGRLHVSGADAVRIALINGGTRAVRIGADATAAYVEGVDQTGVGSYQPLYVGGSVVAMFTGGTERARLKSDGQFRFVPLAAAPTTNVENGDVYYDSTTNKLRVRAAGAWVDLH